MITFGSLFSGIGGLDLGLERAGMECAWQVELDDYCAKVLNKHWPDVPKYKDVRDVGKHNLETVDLIAGGFPCQPHSVAGKRKGAADDRNLWPEFIRIVRDLKPRYVLGENVPGIVTTYLDTVLSDLESEGYTCTTFNLPAVAFDAPHRRERIFIVAYSLSEGNRSIGGGIITRSQNQGRRSTKERGEIICGRPKASFPSDIETRGKAVALTKVFRFKRNGANRKQKPKTRQPKKELERRQQALAYSTRGRRQSRSGREAERCFSEFDKGSNAPDSIRLISKQRSRRRRIREGNQEHHTTNWPVEPNVGRVAHGISSRVDRLRGLGNAVVPQVAEWIGERIIEFERSNNNVG